MKEEKKQLTENETFGSSNPTKN